MSSKGKRRRDARRRARQREYDQTVAQEHSPQEGDSEEPQRRDTANSSAVEVRQSRASRKRARRKAGVWERASRIRISPWLIATPIVAVVIAVVAVLILTSGSSGTTAGGGSSEPTEDSRVAGLPVDSTESVSVNDVNFDRTGLTGNAGEVIEFVVTNTGTISHNMVFAGPDDEYDTGDDFEPDPFAIEAGQTGRLKVKLDDPGVYRFRCAFHPNIEFGTLTLQ